MPRVIVFVKDIDYRIESDGEGKIGTWKHDEFQELLNRAEQAINKAEGRE